MLLCVDFCGGYCSFLVNYSVWLDNAGLQVNRELSQAAKEKISCQTQKCNFWKCHRPILIKTAFLESAHHQLSNGICNFFWAFHDLPTNRGEWGYLADLLFWGRKLKLWASKLPRQQWRLFCTQFVGLTPCWTQFRTFWLRSGLNKFNISVTSSELDFFVSYTDLLSYSMWNHPKKCHFDPDPLRFRRKLVNL